MESGSNQSEWMPSGRCLAAGIGGVWGPEGGAREVKWGGMRKRGHFEAQTGMLISDTEDFNISVTG